MELTRKLLLMTVFVCGFVINVLGQAESMDNGRSFKLPAGTTTRALAAPAGNNITIPAQAKKPVVFNFDQLPGSDWYEYDCGSPWSGFGSGTVSHGLLTINSPTCYEYILYGPKGIWNKYVSNQRGWVVEASLKIDLSTVAVCGEFGSSAHIWANDHTLLLIVGFSTNGICIEYPRVVVFPMNTTDAFHVYRVEVKGMHVRIFADGSLVIDEMLSYPGGGTQALSFGDGTTINSSLAQWDYFSYNVFPDPALPDD